MEMQNSRVLPVSQEAVWQALNDPAVLRQCIPGCESLERTADDTYDVAMLASVGPVKAHFKGRMTLADVVPPTSYVLRFDGQGGAAGFGRGEAQVTLAAQGAAETLLTYHVKAQVGGKLAQLGSRLVDGAARKLADDFFSRFTDALGVASGAPGSPQAEAASTEAETAARQPTPAVRRLWLWVALAAAVVVAVLYGGHVR
ncbi:CoxG family protein [Pandoraea sp.]|uniref:CoxG family protein n=1 Tax=Pandoraea sp. TaxID=1883445 RepID=UPI0011FD67B7|nr:carbon monoxide dehydrogenase subunit G [Pandoraea sp.]TAL55636.1 MAG: carbon monoxide dehydrogenase [Pandoraea sp.]TAM16805.1 MAG: carbon monoxide dehydrogenase [Pandoraea sp.]